MRPLRAVLPPLVLVIAAVAVLWDVLFFGAAMMPGDHLYRFEPWRTVFGERPVQNHYLADVIRVFHPVKWSVAHSLREGHFPLWLSSGGLGYPLIATQESYLTWAMPLYAIADFWTARSMELFGILLLTGIFTYAYLRHHQLGHAAATLGGVVGMLGFQYTQNILNGHVVGSLLWLPLILLALDKSREKASHRLRFVAGGVTGIALLGGSLQGMLYLLFMVGLDMMWQLYRGVRDGRTRDAVRQFALECLQVVAFGMVMSAVRLLPSLELLAHSERTLGVSLGEWARATGRRLAAIPLLLIAMISPGALGEPRTLDLTKVFGNFGIRGTITGQEWKAYVGIIPLGCMFWSIRHLRGQPEVRRHLALFLIPVVLATVTPMTFLLYFPRGLVMAVLPMAALTAYGAQALLNSGPETLRSTARRWGWAWLALIAVASLFTVAVRMKQPQLTDRARSVVASQLKGVETDAAERAWQLAKADRFVSSMSFPSANVTRPAVGALAGLLCLLLLARGRRRPAIALGVAITILDLANVARGFLPVVDRKAVFPMMPAIRFLKTHAPDARVLAIPESDSGRPFFPSNTLMQYGVADARLYESLFPSMGLTRSPELYDAIGVTHLVTPRTTVVRDADLVYDAEVRIFQRPSSMPRAYAAFSSVVTTSDSAGVRLVREGGVDLHRQIILDEGVPTPSKACAAPPVAITEDNAEHLRLTTTMPCDGYLVLADRWYPGWTATVNGRDARILRANLGLRAVEVAAGETVVDFDYRPANLRIGATLSLLGLLTTCLLLLLPRREGPAATRISSWQS